MRRRKREQKRPSTEAPKDQEIPPAIRQFIDGHTVRISEPNRFFARKWKAMLPLVSDRVKETGDTFELQPKLFHSFLECLDFLLKMRNHYQEQYADYRASDLIAEALCDAANGISDYPSSVHAWRLNFPLQEVIQCPDKGDDASQSGNESQGRAIWLAIEKVYQEGEDAPELTELTISIAGEPISELLDYNLMDDDSPGKKAAQIGARKIWKTVVERLTVRLGLKRPKRGKPGSDLSYWAAWAHDHAGRSWTQIARAECKQQHAHTESCKRNYRKLAEQFYQRQEKEYLDIAKTLKKQR